MCGHPSEGPCVRFSRFLVGDAYHLPQVTVLTVWSSRVKGHRDRCVVTACGLVFAVLHSLRDPSSIAPRTQVLGDPSRAVKAEHLQVCRTRKTIRTSARSQTKCPRTANPSFGVWCSDSRVAIPDAVLESHRARGLLFRLLFALGQGGWSIDQAKSARCRRSCSCVLRTLRGCGLRPVPARWARTSEPVQTPRDAAARGAAT